MVTSCQAASFTTSQGMYFWQRSRNAVGRSFGSTPRQAAKQLAVAGDVGDDRHAVRHFGRFSKMTTGLLPARSSSNTIAVMSKRVFTGSRMRSSSSG